MKNFLNIINAYQKKLIVEADAPPPPDAAPTLKTVIHDKTHRPNATIRQKFHGKINIASGRRPSGNRQIRQACLGQTRHDNINQAKLPLC